jgi:type II secretory pathway pseudopilin PulG
MSVQPAKHSRAVAALAMAEPEVWREEEQFNDSRFSRSRIQAVPATPPEKGYTLVEAVFSFGIFGIVFIALLAGLTWNLSSVKSARETARATQIVTEKLDTIRLYSWDQINTPGFIEPQFYVPLYCTNSRSGQGLGVVCTGVVTMATAPLTESYRSNMLLIIVDLYWPSTPAIRHTQMSTFVSKYGLQGYIY